MTVPVSDLQAVSPSAIIELYELELNALQHGVDATYRFHAGAGLNAANTLVWNGNEYTRYPIEAEGFSYSGTGQLPRPKLRCSNLFGTITAILLSLPSGLEGAKVTRIRTLARYIDAANFPPRYNDFLNTEQLNAGTWSRIGTYAFGSGSTADATYAPDGTLSADLLVEDTSTGAHSIGAGTPTAGASNTISIHAKQGASPNRYLQITVGGLIAANEVVTFDLLAGTRTTPTTTTIYSAAGMDKLNDGWWRCWLSAVPSNNSAVRFRLYNAYTTTATNYLGNGVSGIYLWGAQLHPNTAALTPYQPVGSAWTGNPYGTPDPTAEFPREVFYIDRRSSESRDIVEFELAAAFDLAGVRAPKRQCIANICQWVYKSPECSYAGSLPTCSKTLDDCTAHFGAGAELPYGSFPGVGSYTV